MPPKARQTSLAVPKAPATSSKGGDAASVEALRTPLFAAVPATSIVQRTNATGGERYEGQINSDGKREGKGILRWTNGNVYAGDWSDGSMCGDGTFFYAVEGDRYSGGFQEDKKHGSGKYTFANGNSYSGDFASDKRHGRGRYSWMCGDEYEGEWREGRMHGQGITSYANGNRYVGQFVEDRREGRGKLTCTDGLSYDGEWVANNRHGQGRLDFPTGDFYHGEWVNDKKHGHGQDRFANGNEYVGDYIANAKHGQGTMRYNNGDIYQGGWAADKMQGPGVYKFANGFVYDGEWVADMRHGSGEYRFPNGHVYRGEWANDRRHGTGRLELSAAANENAGEIYSGTWVEGKMNGHFVVTTASGDLVYSGAWCDGAPTGEGTFHLGSRHLVGAFHPDASGKKGIGTIDVLPSFLTHLFMPGGRSKRLGAAAHTRKVEFQVQASARMPDRQARQDRDLGSVMTPLRRRLTESQDGFELCAKSLTDGALTSSSLAVDELERLLQDAQKVGSAKRSHVAVDSSEMEALHLAATALEAEVGAARARLQAAEQRALTLENDLAIAKKDRIDKKQRQTTAEQRQREHGAVKEKLQNALQAVDAAERAAVAAESEAALLRAAATEIDKVVATHDAELASRHGLLTALEASVQSAQRKQRALTSERKAQLKALSDAAATTQAAITAAEGGSAALRAACGQAEKDLAEAEASQVACANAADAAVADADARFHRSEAAVRALRAELDEARRELDEIRLECDSKQQRIVERRKNGEKHSLEQRLHADAISALAATVEAVRQKCERSRVALASATAATEATQLRRELRRKLDKELLLAETQAKFVENQLEELQRAPEQPTPGGNVDRGEGGAAGRLKRIRSFADQGGPGPQSAIADDDASEQLRQLQRKISKRREKLDSMHTEALSQCGGWLPPSDPPGAAVSTLVAASRESQMHQVMKLRAQYERLANSTALVAAERERLMTEAADSDEAENDDAADPTLTDEERFVRQIAESMKAEERDWRCSYLLEQIEARRKQILQLSEQAKLARTLEKRLNDVNNTINGYKAAQPRSAGPRPVAESPLGLPPRSKPSW